MTFPDAFSQHPDRYLAFRPTYPEALFSYLATLVPVHNLAWDCATGNGQAALGLAPHFGSVLATDASAQQIARAKAHPKVSYLIAPAEQTPIQDASVDLVAVASAFHWLNFPRFFEEVRRVAAPHGILAAWGYRTPRVTPQVDAIVERFARDILGPFWLPQTRHASHAYETIPFPFEKFEPPAFRMTRAWDCNHLLGHLGTWSGALLCLRQTGSDPTELIRDDLSAAWGNPSQEREITWDLYMRVGKVGGG